MEVVHCGVDVVHCGVRALEGGGRSEGMASRRPAVACNNRY